MFLRRQYSRKQSTSALPAKRKRPPVLSPAATPPHVPAFRAVVPAEEWILLVVRNSTATHQGERKRNAPAQERSKLEWDISATVAHALRPGRSELGPMVEAARPVRTSSVEECVRKLYLEELNGIDGQ